MATTTLTQLTLSLFMAAFSVQLVSAEIISGYRIKIDGLGTLILLGDYHRRTINDSDQYEILRSFLKVVAQEPHRARLNLETIKETQEGLGVIGEDRLKKKLEATKVITKLRILMNSLKEEPGLNNSVAFETSDPRKSLVWDIFFSSLLQAMVRTSLETKGNSVNQMNMLSSLEEDNKTILERYARFLERASRELPACVYKAAEKILNERTKSALTSKKALMEFFNTYARGRALHTRSISKIIYNYARKEHPQLVEYFSTSDASDKEKIVDTITRSFYSKIQPFFLPYYTAMVNIPWLIDSLNSFMKPRSAKIGMFYAGNAHIRQMVTFMQQLQTELTHDYTIRFIFTKVSDESRSPLSKAELEKVLDLSTEIEIMELRKEICRLKGE